MKRTTVWDDTPASFQKPPAREPWGVVTMFEDPHYKWTSGAETHRSHIFGAETLELPATIRKRKRRKLLARGLSGAIVFLLVANALAFVCMLVIRR